jgi:NADH-quinone oxidoreductase subunit M
VLILSAVYLLYMYQRVVFGDVSPFLRGLGEHLTDIAPAELLTLAPLAILTVVFGVVPGLVLILLPGGGPGIGIAGLP